MPGFRGVAAASSESMTALPSAAAPPAGFRMMRRPWTLAAAATAAALGWGEWLNHRWSRALVSEGHRGTLAVVVPGFRNRQSSANLVNRWRVRIALRSIEPDDEGAVVISSGGATNGGSSEAQLMADYATGRLAFRGKVVVEDQSRTTWENITNVLPLVENVDRIKIASQPAHAFKARAYVRRQRPDLADRLVRANDYRPGELIAVKPVLALYGLWTLRGLDPDERRTAYRFPGFPGFPATGDPVVRGGVTNP